jgi:branched-chain amino acid transport system permease protein
LVAAIVIAATAVFATLVGAIAIRARGVYFALITFSIAELLGKIANNLDSLGGSDGLIGVPVPVIGVLGVGEISLGNNFAFFYFALVLVCGLYLGVRRLLRTPFGSVLQGIRGNRDRVPFLGYNPFWYKLIAYLLAAEIAAVGGLVYPLLRGFVAPNLFGFDVSTKAVVMALVGGIGTLVGPLLGGGIITFMESVISSFTERHLTVLGVIFIVFVLFCPDGLVGLARRPAEPRPQPSGEADA